MIETDRLQCVPIAARSAHYIKLGPSNAQAGACVNDGVLGLAFAFIPHELCLAGDWDSVRALFLARGLKPNKASDHVRELRTFYEAGSDAIWITFHDGLLWWGLSAPDVQWREGASLPRQRIVIGGWRSGDTRGLPLRLKALSTRLTQVGAYRASVCAVRERDYLLRKLNGECEPVVAEAKAAQAAMSSIAERLIRSLHQNDFELLVDLIFAASGWRRVSVLGETQKDADILVEQIATEERAFVQVKSSANAAVLADYVSRYRSFGAVNRLVFACHTPTADLIQQRASTAPDIDLWFAETLAAKALRAGLFEWLIERSS